jgi:hypothetical protein
MYKSKSRKKILYKFLSRAFGSRRESAFEKQGLTLESILGEIWYGSRRLHLIGAPIRVFKKIEETRSELFRTRPGPRSTRRVSLMSKRALGNFTNTGRSSTLGGSSLAKHSGLLMIFGTMGTTHHGL